MNSKIFWNLLMPLIFAAIFWIGLAVIAPIPAIVW